MTENNLIIGIAGFARSGKDTAGNKLVADHGFKRYAFADELKDIVNNMFNWDDRHGYGDLKEVVDPALGFSPRRAYQLFGTEFARALDENFWINRAKAKTATGRWVFTDVRFDKEANFIRENGVLIHVERPGVEPVEAHESEKPLKRSQDDYVILNDATKGQFYRAVDMVMADIINNAK